MNKLFSSIKILLVAGVASLTFACSNDDATVVETFYDSFSYSIDDIYGIWESYQMLNDSTGEWCMVDGSDSLYSLFSFSIRFNSDASYLLDGYTSNESGTYTAVGSIITTYIDGVKQAEYDILSIDDDCLELIYVRGTDATNYRITKRW